MDFKIEKIPDKPIILFEPTEKFNLGTGLNQMVAAASALLDEVEEPVFYIPDMRQARIRLDDMFLGITQVALGEKPFLRHPKIREVLVIVSHPVIKKIANAIGSGLYGNIALRTFADRQTALDYADSLIRASEVTVIPASRGSV